MNLDYRAIAKSVIQRAQAHDANFPMVDQEQMTLRVNAWSTVFQGKVWPTEAIAAVDAHYTEPGAWPIKAGDVIDYCSRQPVWSSDEHTRDFLLRATDHPYSGLVGLYSGITEPVIAIMDGTDRNQERAILSQELRRWVLNNLDELVLRTQQRKHQGLGAA